MGFKPSEEEQKWAKQQDIDLKKKLNEFIYNQKKSELEELIAPEAVCPYDKRKLDKVEIDDTGIYVYKCDFCGGIWLNRTNSEKLFHSAKKSDKLMKYLSKIFNINI